MKNLFVVPFALVTIAGAGCGSPESAKGPADPAVASSVQGANQNSHNFDQATKDQIAKQKAAAGR